MITFGVRYSFFDVTELIKNRKRVKQKKKQGENKFECMIRCIHPDAVMIPHPQPAGEMHKMFHWIKTLQSENMTLHNVSVAASGHSVISWRNSAVGDLVLKCLSC